MGCWEYNDHSLSWGTTCINSLTLTASQSLCFWFQISCQTVQILKQKIIKIYCTIKASGQNSSVGSMLDWYHGGCGFKSRQGRGFFRSTFELQYMQLAWQSIRMFPSVWKDIIVRRCGFLIRQPTNSPSWCTWLAVSMLR